MPRPRRGHRLFRASGHLAFCLTSCSQLVCIIVHIVAFVFCILFVFFVVTIFRRYVFVFAFVRKHFAFCVFNKKSMTFICAKLPSQMTDVMSANHQLYENLRQLITVVDELRDVGLQKYINLPRIVATGTQSSGKSSVIESIVGFDFLPRGDGCVTRRPLELRLVHLSATDYPEETSWVIFEKSHKKFTDFDEVRSEIAADTDLVAGNKKGIIDDPIVLTMYSTACPDLTLIDLPGITRVPVAGQSDNIEQITRDMTLRYITDPRTIILAVVPANQDMAVSDALQLAMRVDPQGLRTIGVITKIDIMDKGVDAVKMIKGEDIHLRLGFVGVRLRSQQDIQTKMSVRKALETEKEWFQNHHLYSKMPPGLLTVKCLIDRLTKVLFRHIRHFLPEIKKEINERRCQVQDRLDQLGTSIPVVVSEKVQLIWTLVNDFCNLFQNTIRGKYDRKLQRYLSTNTNEISGGAQIRTIFNEFIVDLQHERVTNKMSDDDIENVIQMHEGDSLPGFSSTDTFEFLLLPHLQKVQQPSIECLGNVSSTLDALAQKMTRTVFRRFPSLADQVLHITQSIIEREKQNTSVIVEQIVAYETGYTFTNDEKYLYDHGSMGRMYDLKKKEEEARNMAPPPPPSTLDKTSSFVKDSASSAHGTMTSLLQHNKKSAMSRMKYKGPFVEEIRKRLDAYFGLMVRNVRDSIPKAIGHFLVRRLMDKLQFELFTYLNDETKISALLGEPAHIVEERRALTDQIATLQKAIVVLQRDPNIALITLEGEEDIDGSAPPLPRTMNSALPTTMSNGTGPQASTAGLSLAAQPPAAPPARMFAPSASAPRAKGLFDDSPDLKSKTLPGPLGF
eukprot:GEMP01004254.1.p1 GENE.GEMP01004254.1~~GEMP01004254.1.p1  ORF type:complete len:847 (-),score=157.31 GEMP01004254.1:1014-3554(-)